jgi:hypothetical protein
VRRRYNSGVATVEFAIVGMLALVLLIGVLEIGRAVFVQNALEESTRRAARLAAVCPISDPAIVETALFEDGDGEGLVTGLAATNISIQYLSATGAVLADPTAAYTQIRFVRARINNFDHQLIIPLFPATVRMPAFETTLPRESLGVSVEGVNAC